MVEAIHNIIDGLQDWLWTYVNIGLLIGCALYFTFRTRFVQFRLFKEMFRMLSSGEKKEHGDISGLEKKQISSFQAFVVALASRIGTGNLAGVATAISVGGPGAIFWMWVMALFGSATAFVESLPWLSYTSAVVKTLSMAVLPITCFTVFTEDGWAFFSAF